MHICTVLDHLRRELVCAFFICGTVGISRTNYCDVLDFGSGACNNQAVFTSSNGPVHNITLN